MNKKHREVLLRSDRVLVGALAVVLVAASAALGAASAVSSHTDEVGPVPVRIAIAAKPTVPLRATIAETVPAAIVPISAPVAPAPLPKPVAIRSSATDVVLAQLLAEHRCLSEVMYYEARGEGANGEMAVAEVIFHRLRHGNFGHSICSVVYAGVGTSACQFSFACNGELAKQKSGGAWRSAEMLAARILTGQTALGDMTGDATYFHAASVAPDWSGDNGMERTAQIGNHVFYRRVRSHLL